VQQDTALFNTSIFENVRYCAPNASRDDVRSALSQANCNRLLSKITALQHESTEGDVISSVDPLDYIIGIDGNKLSGGERQRLALARALLADPMLLVMDETAASLDADGESALMDAIRACTSSGDISNGNGVRTHRRNRALVLITHHAKCLKHADQIVVLDEGVVVETGAYGMLRSNPSSALCRLMPELLQPFIEL
jgi:ABC-type multidrug transport system fused ATPase/permease subunit